MQMAARPPSSRGGTTIDSAASEDAFRNGYANLASQSPCSHRNFFASFHKASSYNGTHAVLLLDIDRFKLVNDTYGHAVGDVVLKTFTTSLKPLRSPTNVFGSLGGEEFVAILQNTAMNEAFVVAERLREYCGRIAIPSMSELRITCSCGVALWNSYHSSAWDDMLAATDRRLYAAKRAGRNQVCSTEPASVSL